jgi:hypothetical protein
MPSNERIKLVDRLLDGDSMPAFCRDFSITLKTGIKKLVSMVCKTKADDHIVMRIKSLFRSSKPS